MKQLLLKYFFCAFVACIACKVASAKDQHIIDSLKAIIEAADHDSSVCSAYLLWGEEIYLSNLDTAHILWQKAHDIARENLTADPTPTLKKKYLSSLAVALINIGYIHYNQGGIQKALEYFFKSLKIREEIGDKMGVASCLHNIGATYMYQGNIQKALEFNHKSLKIREEIGDKMGVASSLNIIGAMYNDQGDIQKGLEYFHKSLEIRKELGNKRGMATSLNNIGRIYKDRKDIQRALGYYLKCLKIYEEIDDKIGVATSLNNIGTTYDDKGDNENALEYYHKSLKIYKELGYKKGLVISFNNIGVIYLENGDVISAKEYAEQAMQLGKELGFPDDIIKPAKLLSKVYRKEGYYKKALKMYELHIQMRDSIKNEETQKATIRQQTKYEFEKAQLIKEQEEKERVRLEAETTARRDNLQYSVILIALLVLFGGVLSLGFVKVSPRMAEGIIFFSFLILFEFFLVLADPYIDNWSGGAPGIKLLFNAGIAALIFPAHAFFESRMKNRIVK